MLSNAACSIILVLGSAMIAASAHAQTVPEINQCKTDSLSNLDEGPIQPGDTVEIEHASGNVTYTVRPGESIWALCATTLRASEAFDEKVARANSRIGAQEKAVADLQGDVSRLQTELAQAQEKAAADTQSAQAPLRSVPYTEPPARSVEWLPWTVAGVAIVLAVVFFVRSVSLARYLSRRPVN